MLGYNNCITVSRHMSWCSMCISFLNFVSKYILELKSHVLSLQMIMYYNSVFRLGV